MIVEISTKHYYIKKDLFGRIRLDKPLDKNILLIQNQTLCGKKLRLVLIESDHFLKGEQCNMNHCTC